ncbi:MAG: hypothetical protein AABX07_05325 [Nanoarchaeota archaeon]
MTKKVEDVDTYCNRLRKVKPENWESAGQFFSTEISRIKFDLKLIVDKVTFESITYTVRLEVRSAKVRTLLYERAETGHSPLEDWAKPNGKPIVKTPLMQLYRDIYDDRLMYMDEAMFRRERRLLEKGRGRLAKILE